jgi:hypothetical protein
VADHVGDGSAALARADVGFAGQEIGDPRREGGLLACGPGLGQQLLESWLVLVRGEGDGGAAPGTELGSLRSSDHSADPGQGITGEHVDHPAASESGVEQDHSGRIGAHRADNRGVLTQGMPTQRPERRLRALG